MTVSVLVPENSLQNHPDILHLSGVPQFTAAISALAVTGANPEAARMLVTAHYMHETVTAPVSPDAPLRLTMRGEKGARIRKDIAASASVAAGSAALPEDIRAAARELLKAFGAE